MIQNAKDAEQKKKPDGSGIKLGNINRGRGKNRDN